MGKKQSDIPEDVNKELESPKFGKPTELNASGYVLDINCLLYTSPSPRDRG